MFNPASVRENETYRLQWDFDIQTDHLISARQPDLIIINKKRTYKILDFADSADYRVKFKESKKKDKYLEIARDLKKNYATWKWLVLLVLSSKDY